MLRMQSPSYSSDFITRDAIKLKEAEKETQAINHNVELTSFPADVTDENAITEIFALIKQKY
jgi:hypothetical protein